MIVACLCRLKQEDIEIDYALRLVDISPWYYITAIVIFAVIWVVSRKWNLGLLAGYFFLILAVTIFSRNAGVGRYELVPFWSYSNPGLRTQILLNIILFIPVGLLGGKDLGWKIIPIAAAVSITIEIIQLVTDRGLMEFDDVIHNTLGTAIGYGAYVFLKKTMEKQE